MCETSVGLVVRHHAWFLASAEHEGLDPFPLDEVNTVSLSEPGETLGRVLIGRGPLQRDVQPTPRFWFEHGENPYPVFQCPSIGPAGAGVYGDTKPTRLTADDDDVVVLLDVASFHPVSTTFPAEYAEEGMPTVDTDGQRIVGPHHSMVERLLGENHARLVQAIGMYALYQYPIVWKPLGVFPAAALIDVVAKTQQLMTPLPVDNFIPFRLKAEPKVQNGLLVDDALTHLHRLASDDLHLPLMLLQRTLWQTSVRLRFLETFWILEHLADLTKTTDKERKEREELHGRILGFVSRECPQHVDRWTSMKGLIVQRSARQRLQDYFAYRGLDCDDGFIGRMLKLRHALSHGGDIESDELASVELEARALAREALRRELAARGIEFVE